MGWTHSLYFCQTIHERAVALEGLCEDRKVVEGRVVPPLEEEVAVHAEYVDNFAALALEPDLVRSCMQSVQRRLTSLGLPVHDIENATSKTKLLGWQIDGLVGVIAPTSE